MKKKLVWLVFPLLVLTLAACSLGKSDKAFGYTYEEYNKLLSANFEFPKKLIAVYKYEHNDQENYLLAIKDDFEDGDESTSYYKLDSNYIEKHRMDMERSDRDIFGTDDGYFGHEKPAIDKVIEKYKVTDDHKFEKADSE